MKRHVLLGLLIAIVCAVVVLASRSLKAQQAPLQVQLAWFDRTGTEIQPVGVPGSYRGLDLSPDGKRVAIHRHDGDVGDIWILELDRGTMSRLTSDAALHNSSPIWSPDGSRVAYASKRNGYWGLYAKRADGAGSEELLLESEARKMPMSWSPDAKFIVYWVSDGDQWVLPLTGDRKPFPILRTGFDETHPQVSPDGKWLAYTSTETGRAQIHITSFPDGARTWQVSTSGGAFARWRGDGKELYFLSAPSSPPYPPRMMRAEIHASGSAVQPDAPRELLDSGYINLSHPDGSYHAYAVSADGQRFLIPRPVETRVPLGSNNVPVAPRGLRIPALPDKPVEFDSAEGQRIRVVVVVKGLTYPWSLAFLPDSGMLVTERTGKLRIIRNGAMDPQPVAGVPASRWQLPSGVDQSTHGLMDIALHPRFAENRFVYFTYNKALEANRGYETLALARGKWNGSALTEVSDIFVTPPGTAGPSIIGSRIAFGRDGTLFMTVGDFSSAQDPNSLRGKVLRLRDDGSVPSDNPFVGRVGYRPEIYSLGHRMAMGLAIHPGTGEVWQNEHGPNGGDEINIIRSALNYGWPIVSLGRRYDGPWWSGKPTHEAFEPPVVYWMPSIAVSGMVFYTGDRFPKWKGDVFVGSLRTGQIPGTGHVERIVFNEKMEELRRESLLVGLRQRIRDVRQGPDGLLYVLVDAEDGAVLRIEPVR